LLILIILMAIITTIEITLQFQVEEVRRGNNNVNSNRNYSSNRVSSDRRYSLTAKRF
jgi:hypothetical protein